MNFSDLIPPIFFKIQRKLCNKLGIGDVRIHPFNKIPLSITPKVIMDVGANIGDVALAALKSYPSTKIICFEPVANSFYTLSNRLKSYSERVTLINKALSDKSGECNINITSFHGSNSINPQSHFHSYINPGIREISKEKIQLAKLDEYIEKFNGQVVDILKLDVEGHELNVINGGKLFIKKYVDVIIIECSIMRDNSWENQSISEIFNSLNELGFRFINIFDIHYGNPRSGSNMLCVQFDCVFRRLSNLQKVE